MNQLVYPSLRDCSPLEIPLKQCRDPFIPLFPRLISLRQPAIKECHFNLNMWQPTIPWMEKKISVPVPKTRQVDVTPVVFGKIVSDVVYQLLYGCSKL